MMESHANHLHEEYRHRAPQRYLIETRSNSSPNVEVILYDQLHGAPDNFVLLSQTSCTKMFA